MAENSKIGWCDHSFNGWIGCTEISPACDFCYAREMSDRYGWARWGVGHPRHLTSNANWRKPLKWNNESPTIFGRRTRVFAFSLADWADSEVPGAWRKRFLDTVEATPNLDWLLLSKRHALVLQYLPKEPLKNVRLGLTMENDKMALTRMPTILKAAEAGWKTFISNEPALEPINWWRWDLRGAVGQIIVGAESGNKHRPFDRQIPVEARDYCQHHNIPFFYKQDADTRGRAIHAPELDGRSWTEFAT